MNNQETGKKNKLILVVEDDVIVLDIVVLNLNSLGYDTIIAHNGHEAIAILRDDKVSLDLLFTDVLLPNGIDGLQVANEATLNRPGLPILLTTGYSGLSSAELPMLRKPYRRTDLAKKLEEMFRAYPVAPHV